MTISGEISLNQNLVGKHHYRLIPSRYPTISFFEDLVDKDELETLFEIEAITNDRLRDEVGDISLVESKDRITGVGTSAVMAAFTHVGYPSRFTDGQYGVYYAGLDLKTAQLESTLHREKFLSATREPPFELEMRCYVGSINLALHDLNNEQYSIYHNSDISSYPICQALAYNLRKNGSNGLYYPSVRNIGGKCIGLFKPIATSTVCPLFVLLEWKQD